MGNFKIYNGFGITPTKSYSAAGWDFYVPIITEGNKAEALDGLKKSYKKTDKDIEKISASFEKYLAVMEYPNITMTPELIQKNLLNLCHLLFAVDGSIMRSSQNKVKTFIDYYLIWDELREVPGVQLHCNDSVFINSGIKTALEHNTAGVFFNKSGKGVKGFDTRACVVDEDYTGYVHLNLAFTKDNVSDGRVFCGDKLSQMLLLPIIHTTTCEELNAFDYAKYMEGSERGADGFGSTDNK